MEHARRLLTFSDGTVALQHQRVPGGEWFTLASGPATRADDFQRGRYDVRTDTKWAARTEAVPRQGD